MIIRSLLLELFLFIFLLSACGGGITKKSDSAQGLYEYAVELRKDQRYEEALRAFQDVKNQHPYSRYSTQSELAIADIHFDRESYIEAQTSYEIFKSLHPKNEQNDKVTYRIGMSYFYQLPSTIDRDLKIGEKAIFHFDQVLKSYPESDYIHDAKDKKTAVRKMLAEKELYIAKFYHKQKNYLSALGRYERLIRLFPDHDFSGEALYGATYTAYMNGSNEKGKLYYDQLTGRFPGSTYSKKAKQELKKYVNP